MTSIKAVFALLVAAVAIGAFAVPSSAANSGSSPRSGALHVTKECSQYNLGAGSFCTITSSSLSAIKPGAIAGGCDTGDEHSCLQLGTGRSDKCRWTHDLGCLRSEEARHHLGWSRRWWRLEER